ncbi:hypothetical protein VPH35_110873 [Triticum aestivum]
MGLGPPGPASLAPPSVAFHLATREANRAGACSRRTPLPATTREGIRASLRRLGLPSPTYRHTHSPTCLLSPSSRSLHFPQKTAERHRRHLRIDSPATSRPAPPGGVQEDGCHRLRRFPPLVRARELPFAGSGCSLRLGLRHPATPSRRIGSSPALYELTIGPPATSRPLLMPL